MRLVTFAALCCAMLCACSGPRPAAAETGTALSALPVERCNFEPTERSARRVNSLPATILVESAGAGGGVLRVGVRRDPGATGPLLLELLDEDGGVARTAQIERLDDWNDLRLPLDGVPAGGGPFRFRLQGEGPVWLAPCEAVAPAAARPNVIVYLIDTLRQDHTSAYGYPRDTTPHLEALAADGVKFTQLVPQSSWTRPSAASLLTGVYPATHGAQQKKDIMREGMPSFARALESAGYETHGLVSNAHIIPKWGIGGDFFSYNSADREDDALVDRVLETLEFVSGRPFFLYVHAIAPHSPYWPPDQLFERYQQGVRRYDKAAVRELVARSRRSHYTEIARLLWGLKDEVPVPAEEQQRMESLISIPELRQLFIDTYDADIRFGDEQLGRVLAALREKGLYENTLFIVLSDHGEEFWENGHYFHGYNLYEEQLRVPFVVKLPGNRLAGETRHGLVNVVDIAPTVAELVTGGVTEVFEGKSFVPLLEENVDDGRLGYASLIDTFRNYNFRAAKTPQSKFLRNTANAQEFFFDLVNDPGEQWPAQPTPEMDRLRAHADALEAYQAPGLRVLLTGVLDDTPVVTGTLRASELAGYRVDFPGENAHISADGGQVDFAISFTTIPERGGPDMQEDQALFIFDLPPAAVFSLELAVGGTPVAAEEIHAPAPVPAGASISLAPLIAPASYVVPNALPRGFGVHVWYVPPPVETDLDDLSPELRHQLEAMGYLE